MLCPSLILTLSCEIEQHPLFIVNYHLDMWDLARSHVHRFKNTALKSILEGKEIAPGSLHVFESLYRILSTIC